jgi:hypothetical protein
VTLASRIYITGDSTPIWVDLAPDLVVTSLEEAIDAGAQFVRFDSVSSEVPVYVQPFAVNCVLALTADQIASHREED